MFKTAIFLWRRPDLTPAAFRDRYERVHAVLGARVLAGWAVRYVRRYLEPLGQADPAMPDVLMEIWYPDRAAYDACMAALSEPAVAVEIAADEAEMFEPGRMRVFAVDECESALPDMRRE